MFDPRSRRKSGEKDVKSHVIHPSNNKYVFDSDVNAVLKAYVLPIKVCLYDINGTCITILFNANQYWPCSKTGLKIAFSEK